MNTQENIDINCLNEYHQNLIDWENDLKSKENSIEEARELLRKDIFEKSITYTSTIISVGYASLFIIISTLKDKIEISKGDLSFISFWLIISISLFIAWEVINMIIKAVTNGVMALISKNIGFKFHVFFWILILAGTIIPAGMVIFKLLNLLQAYILS